MNNQEEKLKISIVTVSLNQCEFIKDNLDSVVNQDYSEIEHIVVDGGSTDGTVELLKQYSDLNWVSEPDKGQSDALNKGFKRATGEIIGWINSDDKLHENALLHVADFFYQNPDAIAVVGDLAILDTSGKRIGKIKSRDMDHNFLVSEAKGITQQSIFFKRSVFDEIGYIDEKLNFAMDRDFFIRVAKIGPIIYMPQILAEFRWQDNNKSSLGSYYFSKELIKIRRKYGASYFSKGIKTDLYIILTEPLRRIPALRQFIQRLKKTFFPGLYKQALIPEKQ